MSFSPNTEYLNNRLEGLAITPEINRHIIRTKRQDGSVLEEPAPFFEADQEGNIVINYFQLSGLRYSWKKEDTKFPRHFQRKRLAKPREDQKYSQEKGSGQFPFFTPGILSRYRRAKEGQEGGVIETLFVVEGEFKAFKGDMAGLCILGIPSIHGFYNGDVRGKLHEDIQELIITCRVSKIVFLVDADLLSLRWEANKDLAKRPESFFTAVKLFRESLQLLLDDDKVELQNVYFMHLLGKFMNEAKGLDDLLAKYSSVHQEIVDDLMQFQFSRKYFAGKLINDTNKDLASLRKYLGLYDEDEFYKCYGDFIGDREFLFRGKRYEYDKDKKEVVFVRHEDADKYLRVGIDWVKIVQKVNAYGKIETEMKAWSIAEINRDYKVGRNSDFFINQLTKYDDFCVEPSWNGDYRRVHHNCYNLMDPLTWEYKPGPFVHTYRFLKHIFQGQACLQFDESGDVVDEVAIRGDQFTVIMDWLSILLRYPKQMLPVPILVSKENGTGKSTFLKWLQMIFGSNMCILGNEQFKMKFNGHYITKFIIGIDEGFLDVDKKAEKERLKQLVTTNSVYLENKGMNVTKINFFGKLIICSNDADRVMRIDEGESRWFVVKVPVIPRRKITGKELLEAGERTFDGSPVDPERTYELVDADPDLEAKMMAEIPAVLHYLRTRSIHHPKVDRLWFKPEWFITDQMRVIVETTKNRVDRVFEDWITEQFLLYKLPVLRYPMTYLTEVFNDPKNSKYKIDAIELKAYLLERKGLKAGPPARIKRPTGFNVDGVVQYWEGIARAITFRHEDWLSEEQIAELNQPTNLTAVEADLAPAGVSSVSPPIGGSDDLPF